MGKLSHMDKGRSKMVDISEKGLSERIAIARGWVEINSTTLKLIEENSLEKGGVYETARIAGILGGKKASSLIPLCHPIPVDNIDIIFWVEEGEPKSKIYIESMAKTTWKTGIEMEAMTAVSVAALTIYDMIKGVEKEALIGEIKLIYKSGGKSGEIKLEEAVINNVEKMERLKIR